ncbi:hypothetical protein ACHAWF_015272 [Thalassiosira exigua]
MDMIRRGRLCASLVTLLRPQPVHISPFQYSLYDGCIFTLMLDGRPCRPCSSKRPSQPDQVTAMSSTTSDKLPAAQTVASVDVALAGAPLSNFDLLGYRPSPDLSDDVNYMDVVMIVTRTSKLRQGSMGCILVKPTDKTAGISEQSTAASRDRFFGDIIAAATNTSLFQPDDSDVHAEINAIGQVARRAHDASPAEAASSTKGATAYITMPPCKRCFGALHAAGVKRVVARIPHPEVLRRAAGGVGIELASLAKEEMMDQKSRLDALLNADEGRMEDGINSKIDKAEVLKRRRQRKEEKQTRKIAKVARSGANGSDFND